MRELQAAYALKNAKDIAEKKIKKSIKPIADKRYLNNSKTILKE